METERRNLQDSLDTARACGFTIEELEQAREEMLELPVGAPYRATNLLSMLALCVANDLDALVASTLQHVYGSFGGMV